MLWDIKPCSPLEFHRRFGGTYILHFQVEEVKQETSVKQTDGGDMYF
jgi:hypothetical protein